MPQENKKRGRRAEAQKRKLDDERNTSLDNSPPQASKKRKREDGLAQHLESPGSPPIPQQDPEESHQHGEDFDVQDAQYPGTEQAAGKPFYGLLDESELEYFRRADDMLQVNQFATFEERALFLENVYKEADGKELKLACSQSSSRLLERLILLSTSTQLKALFNKFIGHFLNLVQHRFASHCCETLFVQAAPLVTEELLSPTAPKARQTPTEDKSPLMEELYISAVKDLQGNLGYLITDKFASHTLRVLLLVLSGQPLSSTSSNAVMRSKRKEHIDVSDVGQATDSTVGSRVVPDSFKTALKSLIEQSVSGLDTHSLRTLATHKLGNPVLQVLLQIESTQFGKQRSKDDISIMKTILPDDPIKQDTESARFINGILYDPIGSHLVEAIVINAHGKLFKALYSGLFKERMGGLARNEIASYVATRILERLGRDDLRDAVDRILPQFNNLAERGRTAIIRTLIERCDVREVDTTPIATALRNIYTDDDGSTFSVAKLLNIDPEIALPAKAVLSPSKINEQPIEAPIKDSSEKPRSHMSAVNSRSSSANTSATQATLLAQALLCSPGALSTLMFESISKLSAELCLHIAFTPALSPVLQKSLTVSHAPLIFRRKLITRFYSHIGALSLDPSGSHLVDAILQGTQGLAFVRERIAEELAENEKQLRESFCGRKVWRNWRMDLYRRRRGEWVRLTRESVGNDGFLSFPGGESDVTSKHKKYDMSGATSSLPSPALPISSTMKGHASRNERQPKGGSNNINATPGMGKTKLDLARERYARAAKLKS